MTEKSKKRNTALYTLAGTVVTTLGAIATNKTPVLLVTFIVIAAILAVFTLVLLYQMRQDGSGSASQPQGTTPEATQTPTAEDLHPDHLASRLTPVQQEFVGMALNGAVSDVANVVGMPAELVRANLFSSEPGTDQLGMVKDLWRHMDRPEEHTVRIGIGFGAVGIAWDTGDANIVIWNEGWGKSDIGNDAELSKVHPELRWILSVPIFGSRSSGTQLVLNVDGLRDTPSKDHLATALGHLPRFGQAISRILCL